MGRRLPIWLPCALSDVWWTLPRVSHTYLKTQPVQPWQIHSPSYILGFARKFRSPQYLHLSHFYFKWLSPLDSGCPTRLLPLSLLRTSVPPVSDHYSLFHLPAGVWFLRFLTAFDTVPKVKTPWHSIRGISKSLIPTSMSIIISPHILPTLQQPQRAFSSLWTHWAPPVPLHKLFFLPTRPFLSSSF